MQRDNRKIPRQRLGTIGTLGNRKAKQNGIRKQAAKADCNTIFPVALEQGARAKDAQGKAAASADVKTDQQAGMEGAVQIKACDGLEKKARDRKALRKPHEPIHPALRKKPAPDQHIPRANNQEDREDDIKKGVHLWVYRFLAPSGASATRVSSVSRPAG